MILKGWGGLVGVLFFCIVSAVYLLNVTDKILSRNRIPSVFHPVFAV